jgi:DNA repair photolyase
MIVCASRRTDIPAFHAEWMINRLRAGYALVRNPVQRDVVYKVNLAPRNIDMLVFMTKDPRPIAGHLDEMTEMGIRYCFQVTVTPYGKDVESGVPFKADIVDSFKEISDKIGKDRIIWRYDPVIINDRYDIKYHSRKFSMLCDEFQGYTDRCTFGFVDLYKKLERLSEEEKLRKTNPSEIRQIGKMMSETVKGRGMQLNYCCADVDLSEYGISHKGCIDKDHMTSLNAPSELSPPLRDRCKCVKNIDIGSYDTCDHNCIYCYANASSDENRKRKVYDPEGELLFGTVKDGDRIVELSSRQVTRIVDY